MSKQTVTINGRIYDVHTGMPVDTATLHRHETPLPSHTMHQATQRSQTLNRHTVKKNDIAASIHVKPKVHPDISRHPSIAKFVPHTSNVKPKVTPLEVAPVAHPIAAKANQQLQSAKAQKASAIKSSPKPSQVIKQEAIQESLAKAPSHGANNKQIKQPKRYPRILSIASASLALLLLGGYFTYLNMPSLSVRVAAAQAGVNASYPSYRPDGYSLNGPVAYSQGQVTMKFASNSGPQSFTVDQAKTNWDSSAVLDNYVKQKAGDNYITYDEHGLTIYTYGSNAAWVNGGILYTIGGDAPLSSDQIRHIATSM